MAETETRREQQHSVARSAHPSPPLASGGGNSPSFLVTVAIIGFVFVASASIYLLLRFLSRQSTPSSTSPPLGLPRRLSSSSSSSAAAAATPPSPSSSSESRRGSYGVDVGDAIVDSLPLFTLSSSIASLPMSSPDCAVCLSRFHPDEQLRLLPSCRHAFHSACIGTWLRSSITCPLCRSPISRDPLPPPSAPPPPPAPPPRPRESPATTTAAMGTLGLSDRSGSYRVEIGSVSRRRTSEGDAAALRPHARSYSLGSSFEYVVEREDRAVVSPLEAHVRRQRQTEHNKDVSASIPAPPGEDVAEAAGGGSSRPWLRDYVDRLASSASSSFSSLRHSRRGSRCTDGGAVGAGGSWDLESYYGQQGDDEDPVGAFYAFFHRWLTGA